jgi:hypothetical protein
MIVSMLEEWNTKLKSIEGLVYEAAEQKERIKFLLELNGSTRTSSHNLIAFPSTTGVCHCLGQVTTAATRSSPVWFGTPLPTTTRSYRVENNVRIYVRESLLFRGCSDC